MTPPLRSRSFAVQVSRTRLSELGSIEEQRDINETNRSGRSPTLSTCRTISESRNSGVSELLLLLDRRRHLFRRRGRKRGLRTLLLRLRVGTRRLGRGRRRAGAARFGFGWFAAIRRGRVSLHG